MSPCQHGLLYPSLLSCTSSSQLSDFCAFVVPCIWAGSFKQPSLMNAKRYATFKLFCHKVLKATQISCACVLLALYYIHRLRSAYPFIRASIGSEIRLFTTALILANKFLDDNTFTNKTWSDVSSIPVRELNIMEMEFLSALNYNIYVHHQQFFAWVNQCHQWLPLAQSVTGQRPVQSAVRPPTTTTITPPSPLAGSTSMPAILPSASMKRPAEDVIVECTPSPYQPPAPKRRYHVPYTPPDEAISFRPSLPQTPLYTPPAQSDLRPYTSTPINSALPPYPNSNPWQLAAAPTSCQPNMCRPILSWSSSSSALASSRHAPSSTTSAYSAASSVATAAAAVAASTSLLASKVRCLEIE